jgi:predicted nuclease with TOPRIM domain
MAETITYEVKEGTIHVVPIRAGRQAMDMLFESMDGDRYERHVMADDKDVVVYRIGAMGRRHIHMTHPDDVINIVIGAATERTAIIAPGIVTLRYSAISRFIDQRCTAVAEFILPRVAEVFENETSEDEGVDLREQVDELREQVKQLREELGSMAVELAALRR